VTFGSHRRRMWDLIRIGEPVAHGLLSRGSQVRVLPGALTNLLQEGGFPGERPIGHSSWVATTPPLRPARASRPAADRVLRIAGQVAVAVVEAGRYGSQGSARGSIWRLASASNSRSRIGRPRLSPARAERAPSGRPRPPSPHEGRRRQPEGPSTGGRSFASSFAARTFLDEPAFGSASTFSRALSRGRRHSPENPLSLGFVRR
jgi:hypothetical protein